VDPLTTGPELPPATPQLHPRHDATARRVTIRYVLAREEWNDAADVCASIIRDAFLAACKARRLQVNEATFKIKLERRPPPGASPIESHEMAVHAKAFALPLPGA
jgi:hypothetical protein